MKKTSIFISIVLCSLGYSQAQVSCEENLEKAKALLTENSPFNDQIMIFNLLTECDSSGNPEIEHYLGMLYVKGLGVEKNDEKALAYFASSAQKGFAKAQYNYGRMHKFGIATPLDLKNAVFWFEQSVLNGNLRAAYALGYMYMKGFGVEQNYERALYWFEQSDYPMARHFIGHCYYHGYGVPADEDKALEILLNNHIPNSQTLLKHIQNKQKETTILVLQQTIAQNDSSGEARVYTEAYQKDYQDINGEHSVSPEDINGEWTGKMIQYDWSGVTVERIIPIDLSFDVDNSSVKTRALLRGKETDVNAQMYDGTLFFKTPFVFTLDKVFSNHENELTLDYRIFSIMLKKHQLSGKTYLSGKVDNFIENWEEYGKPLSIVLQSNNEQTMDDDLLIALAEQKEHFIKIYPLPVTQNFSIFYTLEEPSNVALELIRLRDYYQTLLAPLQWQDAGEHTVQAFGAELESGLYVVKIRVGVNTHTRLIIKKN